MLRRHVSINDGPDLHLSEEISCAENLQYYVQSLFWLRCACTHSRPASLKNATFPICGFQRRVIWSSRPFSLAFCSFWRSRSSFLSFFSSTSFTVTCLACPSTLGCDWLTPEQRLSGGKPHLFDVVHTSNHDFSFGFLDLDQSLFGTRLEEGGQRFVPRMFDVHWSTSGRNFLEGSVR